MKEGGRGREREASCGSMVGSEAREDERSREESREDERSREESRGVEDLIHSAHDALAHSELHLEESHLLTEM